MVNKGELDVGSLGPLTYRESWTKGTFLLNQGAHLPLAVHRSARREFAALFESHDSVDKGADAWYVRVMVVVMKLRFSLRLGLSLW